MKRINNDIVYTFKESIKKSNFITIIKYVENKEMLDNFLNKYMDLKASHNVYVSIFRENEELKEFVKEDGEPRNTSGYPIYNIIKSNEIENIAVLVIRHFGGILLGTGALSRAYSNGVKYLLKNEITLKTLKLLNKVYIKTDKANLNTTKSKIKILSPIDLKLNFEGDYCIISFYTESNEGEINKIPQLNVLKIFEKYR